MLDLDELKGVHQTPAPDGLAPATPGRRGGSAPAPLDHPRPGSAPRSKAGPPSKNHPRRRRGKGKPPNSCEKENEPPELLRGGRGVPVGGGARGGGDDDDHHHHANKACQIAGVFTLEERGRQPARVKSSRGHLHLAPSHAQDLGLPLRGALEPLTPSRYAEALPPPPPPLARNRREPEGNKSRCATAPSPLRMGAPSFQPLGRGGHRLVSAPPPSNLERLRSGLGLITRDLTLSGLLGGLEECSCFGRGIAFFPSSSLEPLECRAYFVPYLSALEVHWVDNEGDLGHVSFAETEPHYERLPLSARARELEAEIDVRFQGVELSTVLPGSVLSVAWYPLYTIPASPGRHGMAVLARYQLDSAPSGAPGSSRGDPRLRLDPLSGERRLPVAGLVTHLAFHEGWLAPPPGAGDSESARGEVLELLRGLKDDFVHDLWRAAPEEPDAQFFLMRSLDEAQLAFSLAPIQREPLGAEEGERSALPRAP